MVQLKDEIDSYTFWIEQIHDDIEANKESVLPLGCDFDYLEWDFLEDHTAYFNCVDRYKTLEEELEKLEEVGEKDDSCVDGLNDLKFKTKAEYNQLMVWATGLKYGMLRGREGFSFSNETSDIVTRKIYTKLKFIPEKINLPHRHLQYNW